MSRDDTFEWFDPYEQKERADREAQRAAYGIQTGRQQVEDLIARGTRQHLAAKLEMAVSGLADQIARRVAFELGAKMAHHSLAEHQGQIAAKAFRTACQDILRGLDLPEHARVRVRTGDRLPSREETMTVEYETLQPIRVAHTILL